LVGLQPVRALRENLRVGSDSRAQDRARGVRALRRLRAALPRQGALPALAARSEGQTLGAAAPEARREAAGGALAADGPRRRHAMTPTPRAIITASRMITTSSASSRCRIMRILSRTAGSSAGTWFCLTTLRHFRNCTVG